MKPPKIPPAAHKLLEPLIETAREHGLPLYVVGGPVRDWLLGKPVFDIDLCCEGDPAPVAQSCAQRLGGTAESFGQFNTWRVLAGKLRFDVAMCRQETYAEPAALPVVAPAPIAEDLFRRDFTVNAMALRLTGGGEGELVDPYGGMKDLQAKVLRPLHPKSFCDDPTRVIRAARYLCRFHLKPAAGLTAMAEAALAAGPAARLSRHRLAQELMRVLGEKDCAPPLEKLRRWGYLSLFHPGLKAPSKKLSGAPERLAAMVLALGKEEGENFLATLPVDHALSAQIYALLSLIETKAAPRNELSPLIRKVASVMMPKLPGAALKPAWLSGRDLQERGVATGKDYGDILDAAAMLQWQGKLKTRAQALSWLEKALNSR